MGKFIAEYEEELDEDITRQIEAIEDKEEDKKRIVSWKGKARDIQLKIKKEGGDNE